MATKLNNSGTKLLSGKQFRDGNFRDRNAVKANTHSQIDSPVNGKGVSQRATGNPTGKTT